ncbi:MAG: hypothetical protein IV298_14740 [Cylindrospermopsis raciborskii KL1]|uniref:hypothetical protein n=1 Tax=Cylindrospermopsis raciborskii TaxID=77022 RepID=UPI001A344302|nr:hypothetical protein [Cylindrospermopsis raciborskii]MBG0744708.1 hypothetical protein [Cylindrospermopsis raciborskii KL1]
MIQDEKSGVLIPIHNSNILLPSGENVYTEYQRFSSQAYEYTRQVKKIIDDAREAYRIQHIQGQIDNIKGQIDNINTNDLRSSEESLIQNFRTWTNNANFEAAIDGIINSTVNNTGKDKVQRTTIRIHFTFSENNNDSDIFRRLPWYKITKIDDVAKKFVLLFPRPMYNKESNLIFQLRVLVIRGCEDPVLKENQDKEIKELKETPGVKVIEKEINNSEDLHNILTTENYNILVYNGHSNSENGGQILIGTGTVKIQDFEQDFRQAVRRGLKIAFFNSCDGLGIADFLTAKVGVPAVIVMKEPVPDHFANRFFISFIKDFFKDGNSLSIALENSRKSNEYIKAEFPGSSSLPVLIYSSVLTKDFRVSKLFIFLSNVSNTLKAMKNFLYKYKRKISFIFAVFLVVLLVKVINTTDTLKVSIFSDNKSLDIKASSDGKYLVRLYNGYSVNVFNDKTNFVGDTNPKCEINDIRSFTFKDNQNLILQTKTALVIYNIKTCSERSRIPIKDKDLDLQDFSQENNQALMKHKDGNLHLNNLAKPIIPSLKNIKHAKFWDKETILLIQDKEIKICKISDGPCKNKGTINDLNDDAQIILSPSRKYLALKYTPDDKTTTIRVWKINNNDEFQEITDNLEELKKLKPGTGINSATFLESGKDTELIVIKNH